MPRFRYEFATSLKPALSNLGIERAFDNRADFSGISDAPLYISDVIQKTYINVEEEGAEAAGVTSIIVGLMSAPRPAERKIMTLDRPFIYAIVDNRTGAILFAGRVTEPLQGE
jgi:serpin B